jgi:hypothetical protein
METRGGRTRGRSLSLPTLTWPKSGGSNGRGLNPAGKRQSCMVLDPHAGEGAETHRALSSCQTVNGLK